MAFLAAGSRRKISLVRKEGMFECNLIPNSLLLESRWKVEISLGPNVGFEVDGWMAYDLWLTACACGAQTSEVSLFAAPALAMSTN